MNKLLCTLNPVVFVSVYWSQGITSLRDTTLATGFRAALLVRRLGLAGGSLSKGVLTSFWANV